MNGCDWAPVCGFLKLPGSVTVIVVPFGSSCEEETVMSWNASDLATQVSVRVEVYAWQISESNFTSEGIWIVSFPPFEAAVSLLMEFTSWSLNCYVSSTITGITGCDKVAVMTFGERLSWVPSKLTESIRPPAEGDLNVSTLKPMLALGWVLKGFT